MDDLKAEIMGVYLREQLKAAGIQVKLARQSRWFHPMIKCAYAPKLDDRWNVKRRRKLFAKNIQRWLSRVDPRHALINVHWCRGKGWSDLELYAAQSISLEDEDGKPAEK